MKGRPKKWLGFILIFSFLPFLIHPLPAWADGGKKVISQPKLYINNKGKVSVLNKDGKVESKSTLWNRLLGRYRFVVAGISGVAAVTMILFFILGFIRLGATSDNPRARKHAIIGLVLAAIASAGLGAVALITGIFYNALN